MAEVCGTCRFWFIELASKDDILEEETGFGWCRRHPPKIIDHMARMAIQQPGFGGNVVDREDVASAAVVDYATMFPATFGGSWCGEYQALPAVPVEGAAA